MSNTRSTRDIINLTIEHRDSDLDINQQPGWQAVATINPQPQKDQQHQHYENHVLRQIHKVSETLKQLLHTYPSLNQ